MYYLDDTQERNKTIYTSVSMPIISPQLRAKCVSLIKLGIFNDYKQSPNPPKPHQRLKITRIIVSEQITRNRPQTSGGFRQPTTGRHSFLTLHQVELTTK